MRTSGSNFHSSTEQKCDLNTLKPVIVFVIPCYNEAPGLRKTYDVLSTKIASLVDTHISDKSRILFVDDGSKDETWTVIEQLHNIDSSHVTAIKLAHNRGHQPALYAGLMSALNSSCDATISMDADLQDDIGVVDQFINEFNHGSEIVFGVRNRRDTDTPFKRTTAGMYYQILQHMGIEVVANHADYRLMGQTAMRALSEYGEVNLFLRGIIPSLGFRTSIVYYSRGSRFAGESKYPLKKMISFAIEGITSFSIAPLRFVSFLGGLATLTGVGMFIYVMISFAHGHVISGWGSLMCSIWLLGGLIMLSLGIIGEYLGKIYMETKARPRYFIEKKL